MNIIKKNFGKQAGILGDGRTNQNKSSCSYNCHMKAQQWWRMPLVPALRSQRQADILSSVPGQALASSRTGQRNLSQKTKTKKQTNKKTDKLSHKIGMTLKKKTKKKTKTTVLTHDENTLKSLNTVSNYFSQHQKLLAV